jgi:hypothetical protein
MFASEITEVAAMPLLVDRLLTVLDRMRVIVGTLV